MFKFVLIGVLVLAILAFVMWNFWKMILLKYKHFSESQTMLSFMEEFRDVPEKLKSIRKDKLKTWITASIGTVFIVVIAVGYFIAARNIFLNNHTHRYKDQVIQSPTCVAEGIMQHKCRYCGEKHEDPIPIVEHTYSKTHNQDSTCTQEGRQDYTCDMCGHVITESIPLKEHEYIETIQSEATCVAEGVLAKQCQICASVITESIPVSEEHHFAAVSFTPSTFWKNGYNHYLCESCGIGQYSLRVNNFNWTVILAMVILVIAIIIIIVIRVEEGFWDDTFAKPWFWIALISAVLSIGLMFVHWRVVIPYQEECKPIYQSLTKAPIDCELVEIQRTESDYTKHGTVGYKCQKCGEEYIECLALKPINLEQIAIYTEPIITEQNETESNSRISRADEIPRLTRMTGRLSSKNDVDFYKVTLVNTGHIKFQFTHDGDQYSNHWNATIYNVDQSTVLNDGYINSEEFGCSDLPAGTYYLKISVISGGNPLMSSYSDANYHVMFVPECLEHIEKTQYFAEAPACSMPIQITSVCNHCSKVIGVESTEELEHRWSEWQITEPSTTWSSGIKLRTCTLCGETQNDRYMEYEWVIPLAIAECLILLICVILMFKGSRVCVFPMLLQFALSYAITTTIQRVPIFDGSLWDSVVLGSLLSLHMLLLVEYVFTLIDKISGRRYYRYQTTSIILSVLLVLMLVLGNTVFSGYAITCVIIMSVMALYAIIFAFVSHSEYEVFWMIANIVVAIFNIIGAVYFWFKM